MSGKRKLAVALGSCVIGATFVAAAPAQSAEREQRPNILISSNDQWDADHGVRSGKGTLRDPYVISGWQLQRLQIENTDRHVVIENNAVKGQMVLNWIGDRAHVHHNDIADLRVNQNVRRTGAPTSGEIAHNTFGVVGQLRHWDGTFERNVVGFPDRLNARAVNFDGFNGARFRNNTIYGYMDARLHGHHHSSGFDEGSHQHAGHNMTMGSHTHRYHEVFITGNTIRTTSGYALAYLDTNHAANDRTAPSEQNPELNKPHVHHTRAHITSNRLAGAGIFVNVFSAVDNQKHIRTAKGFVEVARNAITLGTDDFWSFRELYGIQVRQAQDVELLIDDNAITGSISNDQFGFLDEGDKDAGVFLQTLDKARVWIGGNSVTNRRFGVRAEKFTKDVTWTIRDLKTQNVEQRVYHDNSAPAPQ